MRGCFCHHARGRCPTRAQNMTLFTSRMMSTTVDCDHYAWRSRDTHSALYLGTIYWGWCDMSTIWIVSVLSVELPLTFGDECFSPSSKMAAAKEPVDLSDRFLACARANRTETARQKRKHGSTKSKAIRPLRRTPTCSGPKSLGFHTRRTCYCNWRRRHPLAKKKSSLGQPSCFLPVLQ